MHNETLNRNLLWEIRNKSDHNEVYHYRDLQQFTLEVQGRVIHQEGIDKIASPQGYPRSESHSFDVPPKAGTTGDITDYEARIVKTERTAFHETPRRMSRVVSDLYNYVEPTGQ